MHTTAGAAFALQEQAPGRLLHLHGRLDVSAAADVRLALAAAVDAGQGDLVLDLAASRRSTRPASACSSARTAGPSGRAAPWCCATHRRRWPGCSG